MGPSEPHCLARRVRDRPANSASSHAYLMTDLRRLLRTRTQASMVPREDGPRKSARTCRCGGSALPHCIDVAEANVDQTVCDQINCVHREPDRFEQHRAVDQRQTIDRVDVFSRTRCRARRAISAVRSRPSDSSASHAIPSVKQTATFGHASHPCRRSPAYRQFRVSESPSSRRGSAPKTRCRSRLTLRADRTRT